MKRLRIVVAKRVAGERVREKGRIPGVVYGPHISPRSVWVQALDFKKIFSQSGENTLIELYEDASTVSIVLVHDVQHSPLKGVPTHVDFFAVDMKEELETAVPLEFSGVSQAIKEMGGVLVRNMEEIVVRCLPSDIPKSFTVNLEKLATFDDCIYVKDIVHSQKYEALVDGENVVALVVPPRKEETEPSSEASIVEQQANSADTKKEEVKK